MLGCICMRVCVSTQICAQKLMCTPSYVWVLPEGCPCWGVSLSCCVLGSMPGSVCRGVSWRGVKGAQSPLSMSSHAHPVWHSPQQGEADATSVTECRMDPNVCKHVCVCSYMGVEDREESWHSCRQPVPLPNPQLTVFGGATPGSTPALPTHPLPDEDVSPCKSAFSCQD